jgi:hypothetical protein
MRAQTAVALSTLIACILLGAFASEEANAASYQRCSRQYKACNSSCAIGAKTCFEQCQNDVFVCSHEVDVANGKVKAAARVATPSRTLRPGHVVGITSVGAGGSSNATTHQPTGPHPGAGHHR